MSKIKDLIKELCPDGVEYKEIKELCEVTRGRVISKNELRENKGEYPVYSSQTLNNGVFGKINTYDYDGEYVQWTTDGANAGSIFYRNGKFSITNVCGLLKVKNEYKEIVNTNFLNYILGSVSKNYVNYATSNPKLMSNVVEKIKVVVPPLEIQEEIVKILDKFGELEAELEAELETRRSQYEFWRDKMFKFENNEGVKWLKLKDIKTEIYRGTGIRRDEVTEDGIPCVRYGEIYTKYNVFFDECISHTSIDVVSNPKTFEKGDLLFAITGESVEEISKTIVYIGNEKGYAGGDIVVMKHNQNPKYLSYALSTSDAIYQKGKGKVKTKVVHSSVPSIEEIIIPIPTLEEQEKIVNILDKFYMLINDISIGLPAEIKLRRQQYEYYRNKLLSFEELK